VQGFGLVLWFNAVVAMIPAAHGMSAQVHAAAGAPAKTDGLQPGEFRWSPERSPDGPVVVIVSIPAQRAHVYRNGVEIGVTTVSTGAPGHRTPRGVFTILEKEVLHASNRYSDDPMPYMERLTWDGVALHGGDLPGYPASHGCVRLPLRFAELLYGVTRKGTTVVIADDYTSPYEVNHPGLLLPPLKGVPAGAGAPVPLSPGQYTWTPDRAPSGPVTVLISGADRTAYVYRNGIHIGSAGVTIIDEHPPLQSAVFSMLKGHGKGPNPWRPGQPTPRWMAVDISTGGALPAGRDPTEGVRFRERFAELLYDQFAPGTTIYVTDQPASADTTTGPDFAILTGQAGRP
jgi:lipoprotein-anchoring transpeptidase ErfK/SrfK